MRIDFVKALCLGLINGGGYGAVFVKSFDIDRATPEKLIEMAQKRGIQSYLITVS